jgi:hypothetical protein
MSSTATTETDRRQAVETLLEPWRERIGADYAGYLGHILRVMARRLTGWVPLNPFNPAPMIRW